VPGCGAGGSGAACGAHGAYRCRPGGTGNHVDTAGGPGRVPGGRNLTLKEPHPCDMGCGFLQ